jgi:hypothetical protein
MGGIQSVAAVVLGACVLLSLAGCRESGEAAPEADVKLFRLGGYVVAEGTKRQIWGYIDRTGKMVIKPRFAQAGEFREGRAFVKYPDGHWEIIDPSGATIARTGYGEVFSQGRAAVLVAGEFDDLPSRRWGYVDRAGKLVIPGPFASAGEFKEGLAPAEPVNSVVDGRRRGGYIDLEGRMVIPARFVVVSDFSEGLAAVIEDLAKEGYYIDPSGKSVITGLEIIGGDFSEGLAPAGVMKSEECKMGYIDAKGRFVIEPQFGEAKPFSDGRAVVKMTSERHSKTSDWGVIDKSGKFVVPPECEEIIEFSEGRAWVRPRSVEGGVEEKMYLIDVDGRRVSDVEFFYTANRFRDGLSAVYTDDGMGYVDREGHYVWNPATKLPE